MMSRLPLRPIYCLLITLTLVLVCSVLSSGTVQASSVAQHFKTADTGIVAGAIVSLKETGGDSVTLSTLTNRSRVVGVAGKTASIELDNGKSLGVVLSGTTAVLVSDFNGQVKAGDRITTSPIDGVGMRATENVMVVGTAQTAMDMSRATERTITGATGKTRTVKIGAVPLSVAPMYYQASAHATNKSSQVQLFANNLAGHSVSPIRILVSGIVGIILITAVVILIYTSLKSSIVAIGRNPLAKSAIYTSLFQVGVATLGVSAFAVIVVYLILTT